MIYYIIILLYISIKATPFNTDLKCVDHFTADTIGLTGGDFLITTAPTDIGTPAYYISVSQI